MNYQPTKRKNYAVTAVLFTNVTVRTSSPSPVLYIPNLALDFKSPMIEVMSFMPPLTRHSGLLFGLELALSR